MKLLDVDESVLSLLNVLVVWKSWNSCREKYALGTIIKMRGDCVYFFYDKEEDRDKDLDAIDSWINMREASMIGSSTE